MRVIVDDKKRVLLPTARPGDSFTLQIPTEGTFVLTRVTPAPSEPVEVKLEKRGRFTVGILDRPIDEEALKQALAEFP